MFNCFWFLAAERALLQMFKSSPLEAIRSPEPILQSEPHMQLVVLKMCLILREIACDFAILWFGKNP
jgi:hypothetical protein